MHKPRIIIFQYRSRQDLIQEEQQSFLRELEGVADITFQNAFDEHIAWDDPNTVLAGFDAVILAGSGEYDIDGNRRDDDEKRLAAQHLLQRKRPFLAHLLAKDIPTLGVCFGHQLLGHAAGVDVAYDKNESKIGSHPVNRTQEGKDDVLFGALPDTFYAQYGHKDSVRSVPKEATLLAANQGQCQCAALRYGENVYTVQFHPELNVHDITWRLENTPGYLPEGVEVQEVVQPTPYASQILEQFVRKKAARE